MTEFLNNLILRSAADQPGPALLQPRLPSLFGPLAGTSVFSMPVPDLREVLSPGSEPAATVPPDIQLPADRSTIAVEPEKRQPSVRSVESPILPALERTASPLAMETQQESILPFQPANRTKNRIIPALQSMSQLEEPQQTIMPGSQGQANRKVYAAIENRHSRTLDERQKMLPAELYVTDGQDAEVLSVPTRPVMEPFQTAVGPLKDDSPVQDFTHAALESAYTIRDPQPASVLRPIPAASRRARRQQTEQTQVQTPQRVVEIHIGRIEVRAVSPPTPPASARASQKATTMSLEDYLRSRPGEKK